MLLQIRFTSGNVVIAYRDTSDRSYGKAVVGTITVDTIAFGTPANLSLQRDFFTKHVGSWGNQFFVDLESAPSAYFYRPVGSLGRNFLQLEAEAFSIEN